MSLLTCPAVGNFIIGPDGDVDGVDGTIEQPSILLTTMDTSVFSADVGEVRGWLTI